MSKFKKVLALLLVVALTAALSVSLTMAYLQDEDSDVNVMTLGNVKIEQIEQERDINGNLVDFTQTKPAYPVVGPIEWATEGVRVNGTEYKVFTDELKNVVDKIVTVKNTGKSDAYIRTIVAIEAPDYDPNDLIHINYTKAVTQSDPVNVEIEGVKYVVFAFTYADALAPGKISAPSLMQIFLDSKATNEDCAKFGDTWEVLVLSQAIQADGFDKAETALNTGFGEFNAENAAEWFKGLVSSESVSSDEDLKDALSSNEKTIVVTLNGDVTYDVAAWAANGMGGEATENIIINGNGYTITFNQTNTDWNNIVTNGAKLIINNAKITNSGNNDGPWNRHDLNFACEVELNDVVSDKALAFKSNATLNNVVINDANTSDTYAIWIQPKGQTVTLNNVTIDMLDCTDGRGIKIDEEYLASDEIAKVTLNVSNTTFKTEEKSAILVKSAAGADIILSNVDITGVKADPMHEVWVDEASSAYADLVVVQGGKKIVEGTVNVTTATSTSELKNAISGGADAVFVDNANISLDTINAGGADITFNGGTVDYGTTGGFTKGIQHSGTVTYNNATIIGSVSLYGEKVVFNNCTFDLTGISDYIWTYGAKEVEFNGCTFNTKGKAILVYNEGTVGSSVVTVNGCTFNASESAYASAVPGQPCAAVEIDSSLIPGTYTLNFVGENVIDTEFSGLVRVKNDGGKGNVIINGATAVELPGA